MRSQLVEFASLYDHLLLGWIKPSNQVAQIIFETDQLCWEQHISFYWFWWDAVHNPQLAHQYNYKIDFIHGPKLRFIRQLKLQWPTIDVLGTIFEDRWN